MYAELALENKVLKDVISKKVLTPGERNDRVYYIRAGHGYSVSGACKLMNLSRPLYYYVSQKDDTILIKKLKQLAEQTDF